MLTLSRINTGLVILIIAINGYLLVTPFYPRLHLWWETHVNHQQQQLENVVKTHQSPTKSSPPVPAGEWLVIPKLALHTPIFEGQNIYTANKGVWHRPQSSNPETDSNTVLVGHRFTYTNPTGIFYSLDKLTTGDQIALWWNGKQYTYTVSQTRIVPPTELSVEAPSTDARLTLYTCTPLWSAKNRLVVTATRNTP
ncbi:MAG: putative sortase family protein [Candidatus Saccharibacteria bacterium]|nr:putative sortase family protein [Candidatus Saccharibacteria bacterium]